MTAKALKMAPRQVALVTGVPCTLLKMDRSGLYLAVGGSDGIVTVFATETLTRVRVLFCFYAVCFLCRTVSFVCPVLC